MNMKARLYTAQNISRFYLSPYVEYLEDNGKLCFRNDLFNHVVITPVCSSDSGKYLERIRQGISGEELIILTAEMFPGSDPEELISVFMQKGILE
jgi:hypothetical protein